MRRNQHARNSLFVCAALLVAASLSQRAWAQENLALGKTIIDGSGSWNDGTPGVGAPFNGGDYPASKVTDGLTTEAGTDGVTYWLGRQFTNNEYFTVDLGEAMDFDRIDLFNTCLLYTSPSPRDS